jgi:4-hydroxybenzoate polyprenyltransferase
LLASAPAIAMKPVSPSSTRAWFDLARAGNFPSVASNVLAALVLSSEGGRTLFPSPALFALAAIGGCLVYAGGATFNDVFDAEFDARHRPERAIPRQVVSRSAAAWIATIEMILGLGLFVFAGASPLIGAGLAVVIVLYDWLHKRWIGSVVLMAGCRVLLAVLVASLPGHSAGGAFWGWVGALFTYIVTLSLIARWEYKPGAPAAKIGKSVGRLLAFIPLIDALALLLAGAWLPALACAVAVPLGRYAQRLAAST